jgi:hypothetical protein
MNAETKKPDMTWKQIASALAIVAAFAAYVGRNNDSTAPPYSPTAQMQETPYPYKRAGEIGDACRKLGEVAFRTAQARDMGTSEEASLEVIDGLSIRVASRDRLYAVIVKVYDQKKTPDEARGEVFRACFDELMEATK